MDIPEVFVRQLREYVGSINGLLFATGDGRPLQQRNVLRVLHRAKHVGFHAFRRFRLTWLRKNGVPKDLERYWMGHAPEEVGDLYSKTQGRRFVSPRVGGTRRTCWSTKRRCNSNCKAGFWEWSGRMDLNHRPPGPEPGSRWTLKPCRCRAYAPRPLQDPPSIVTHVPQVSPQLPTSPPFPRAPACCCFRRLLPRPFPSGPKAPRAFVTTATCRLASFGVSGDEEFHVAGPLETYRRG